MNWILLGLLAVNLLLLVWLLLPEPSGDAESGDRDAADEDDESGGGGGDDDDAVLPRVVDRGLEGGGFRRRSRRQRSEQYLTSSQLRAHLRRQAKGRPQQAQIFCGRSRLALIGNPGT